MHFYDISPDETLKKLQTSDKGLSLKEVKNRQKQFGLNIIKIKSEPLWKKILEPFLDIFTLVLMVAVAISLWHGETIDAVIIIIIIAISAVIFYAQRFSTDRVLRSLSEKSVQKVDVIRNSSAMSIDATRLVPGDIISLSEGEKVPADMRLIRSVNCRVDESQLTGESLPIAKNPHTLQQKSAIYEQTNMLFQGSFMISGTATGVVTAIGNNTEFGNLAVLAKRQTSQSPVQQKIDKLITRVIAAVSAVSLVAFGLSLLRGMDIVESLRFVMALAVSAVPESLPIAISVVLVLGMRRMAAKKALVHQMRAIETIGVITTIATDKTGTLTRNKLTVQETWTPNKGSQINQIISHAINKGSAKSHDPLDIALEDFSRQHNHHPSGSPVQELPFNQEMSMSANVWHYGKEYRVFLKGAPEHILQACKVSASIKKSAMKKLDDFASKGQRVIGLASCVSTTPVTDFTHLTNQTIKFEGLVAVADILRPEASRAIKSALSAGVSVRMITGDHFETAYQIGQKLGMVTSREEVFDCRQMNDLSDEQLSPIVEKTKVFSRVVPEQKHRLLTILKQHNITAMTGDGVNDVPALSNAHVGVAMGSGSHIARDAGDIILLDDNFKTIIAAMREGRIIIANVRRMLFYLLSTNTGELITMIGALLIGIKTPLEPVQILWVNLVTDTSMVIPLGLEPGEKSTMHQPPKNPDAPIMERPMIWHMIIVALTMSTLALSIYIIFEKSRGHNYAQTLAFISLVVSQWANAFNARSDRESIFTRLKIMNLSFYAGLTLAISLQLLVFLTPFGSILHVSSVEIWHTTVVSLVAFIIPITTSELYKAWRRQQGK